VHRQSEDQVCPRMTVFIIIIIIITDTTTPTAVGYSRGPLEPSSAIAET